MNVTSILFGAWIFSTCGESNKGRIPASVSALLVKHCQTIKASAASLGLPTLAVAGVVAAEQTLNLSAIDGLQDVVVGRLVRDKPTQWWSDWLASNRALEARVANSRFIGNKWPERLVLTFYVVSIGPAQITPRTILRACSVVPTPPGHPCHAGIRRVLAAALDEDGAFELAAVVLEFEAMQWRARTHEDIRADVALLGTLYSTGGDYYRRRYGVASRPHTYNAFGTWLSRHADDVAYAIACDSQNKGSLPMTRATSP